MVMAGYKKTVVGIVPEDWEVNTIESASERVGDVDHRMPQSVDYGIPYIMTGDFYGANGMNFANAKKISTEDFYLLSRKIRPEKGDIIFARYASVGAVRYVETEKPFIISYSCVIIKPAASCNAVYLYYIFQSASMHKQINFAVNTGTQKNVGIDSLKKFFLPLPQYSEQTAIATALSDADAYIAALEKLIAKKRAVKQGSKQELLTGKRRLPGFEGEWVEKRIDDIAVVGRGWVISNETINKSLSNKYPVYSSQTANNGIMGYLDTYDFDGEYITWTTDGVNAGTVFYRNGRFNCTNVCGTLKLKGDEYNTYFVALRLQMETPSHVSTNLANPKLMNDVMKTIIITLPPTLAEQTVIATVLSDMYAEIDALTVKLEKARRIKQGMMSELLTGRIRLIKEDTDNGEN